LAGQLLGWLVSRNCIEPVAEALLTRCRVSRTWVTTANEISAPVSVYGSPRDLAIGSLRLGRTNAWPFCKTQARTPDRTTAALFWKTWARTSAPCRRWIDSKGPCTRT